MTIKNKLLLIFFTIITLGIFWIFYYCKKKKLKTTNQLSRSVKIPFSIKRLVNAIGSNNIIKAEYTHTKVKIYINTTKKINMDEIKKIKSISGTFMTSNSFTIIVGNSAKTISAQLNKLVA